MPRHIKWRQCPTLGYEKLYLESVCWLEFTTKMTIPRATDLHLYFKMFFGNSRSAARQTRTPEITIKTADGKITNGFVKRNDMEEVGSWRWVPVYSDKFSTNYMKVTSECEQTCTIRWFSENPSWYLNISWGGLTFVSE